MAFPADTLNERLEWLSGHPFYKDRVPASVADADEFAATVPLMSRADLVTEMEKPGYGAFSGTNPVRINLSPMGPSLVPAMQTASDMDHMIAAARTNLDACGFWPGDV